MSVAICVDTSVAYKWFASVEEPGLDAAMDLLRAHRDSEVNLLAPSLMRIELLNALRYAGCSSEDLADAVHDLTRFHLEFVDADDTILSRAGELALDHELSVYDAVFLAVAIERDCVLVTADRKAFGRLPASLCEVRLL